MTSACWKTMYRVFVVAALMSVAGCACMGGGMLERVARTGSGRYGTGGGMCGGGMMTHGAANQPTASQPTEADWSGEPHDHSSPGAP